MTGPLPHRWWRIDYTRYGTPRSTTGLYSLDAVLTHLRDLDDRGDTVTGIREYSSVTTVRNVDRSEVEAGS